MYVRTYILAYVYIFQLRFSLELVLFPWLPAFCLKCSHLMSRLDVCIIYMHILKCGQLLLGCLKCGHLMCRLDMCIIFNVVSSN